MVEARSRDSVLPNSPGLLLCVPCARVKLTV